MERKAKKKEMKEGRKEMRKKDSKSFQTPKLWTSKK